MKKTALIVAATLVMVVATTFAYNNQQVNNCDKHNTCVCNSKTDQVACKPTCEAEKACCCE
jgi:hypothetical protein